MREGKSKLFILFCFIFFNSSLFALDNAQRDIINNVIAKQKELSEKISKELLAISEGIKVNINRKFLSADKSAFEKNLNLLINGDSTIGLNKPSKLSVLNQLKSAKEDWDNLKGKLILKEVSNNIDNYNRLNQKLIDLTSKIEQSIELYDEVKSPKKDIRFALSNLITQVMEIENRKEHIISMAGRQTMLSQKIAKEAIFIALKIKPKEYRKKILASASLFDKTLKALWKGDKKLKIAPTKDKRAIKQIKFIEKIWQPFYHSVKKIATSQKIDGEALKYIIKNNENLLRQSHKLLMYFREDKTIKTNISKIAQNALEIADRQRMLSQKMLKEKLLIIGGINPERYKAKIRGTVLLFEHGIQGLLIGDEKRGLIKMSDERIRKELKKALVIWNKVRLIYLRRPNLTNKQLSLIIKENQPLLDEMTKIVKMIKNSTEL